MEIGKGNFGPRLLQKTQEINEMWRLYEDLLGSGNDLYLVGGDRLIALSAGERQPLKNGRLALTESDLAKIAPTIEQECVVESVDRKEGISPDSIAFNVLYRDRTIEDLAHEGLARAKMWIGDIKALGIERFVSDEYKKSFCLERFRAAVDGRMPYIDFLDIDLH